MPLYGPPGLPLSGGTLKGNLLFSTDNTLDIGASGATRPRTGYFGTSVVLGTSGVLVGGTNAIEQRNGTNAQTQYIYSTYTDASNYSRLAIVVGASNIDFISQFAGTGTARGFRFFCDTSENFRIDQFASVSAFQEFALRTGGGLDALFTVPNFRIRANYQFVWTSTTRADDSSDTGIGRNAAGVIEINNSMAGTFAAIVASEHRTAPTSANGQYLAIKQLTELTTIAASATTDTVIQIPANAIVLGVSVRNTVAVTCTSTYTVGDAGNATRYSTAAVSKTVNSTDPGTKAGAYYNASAVSVRITPDTTPSDATGRVRVTIYYLSSTPPTS